MARPTVEVEMTTVIFNRKHEDLPQKGRRNYRMMGTLLVPGKHNYATSVVESWEKCDEYNNWVEQGILEPVEGDWSISNTPYKDAVEIVNVTERLDELREYLDQEESRKPPRKKLLAAIRNRISDITSENPDADSLFADDGREDV